MDLEQAIAVVLEEASRRGQNRIAAALGVSNGTVSKWKNTSSRPDGAVRERVFEFAEETLRNRPPTPDAVTAAILATGENVKRLAEIRGYAQFVLDQLHDLAKRQQVVVDSLEPWAGAEGRQLALNDEKKARELEEATRRAAADAAAQAAQQSAPRAKKKASEG